MDDVEKFIGRFSPSDSAHDVFLYGCCYWFAFILAERFGGTIMIDYVANHFGTKIGDRVYDITGDITELYKMEEWSECSDPLLVERIKRDCIRF